MRVKVGKDSMASSKKQIFSDINIQFFIFWCFFLVGFIIYFPVINAPFQLDDYRHIVRNVAIKHLSNVSLIWSYDPLRFLTYYSLALNHKMGGVKPGWYHVTGILIHIANAFLVYFLSLLLTKCGAFSKRADQQLKGATAFFTAFTFLVHPIQTQAVAYTIQRSILLATFFFLLSVYFYLRFRTDHRLRFYVGSLTTAFFCMFTKQVGIVLPFFILFMEIFLFGKERKSLLKKWSLFFPFALTLLVLPAVYVYRFHATTIRELAFLTKATPDISRFHYGMTQIRAMATYLRLLFFPFRQNLDYDFPIYKSFFGWPVFSSFLLISAFFLGWFLISKREKIIWFGLVWFGLTMIPESSIFPLSDIIFEHRLYLPMVGFSIAAVASLALFLDDKKKFLRILGSVSVILAVLSWSRNNVWSDPIRFMSDVISKSPEKARPYNNLGFFYLNNKFYEKARQLFQKAIELDPRYTPAEENLGVLNYELKKVDEALPHFKKASVLDPSLADPYLYLGHIYFANKKWDQAESAYRQATRLDPSFAAAFNGLAKVYLEKKEPYNAFLMAKRSLYADPDDLDTYYLLGELALENRWFKDAYMAYQAILDFDPFSIATHSGLGNVYFRIGQFKEAAIEFETVLRANARDEGAYFNLANVYHELGDYEKAGRAIDRALLFAKQNGNSDLIQKIESNKKRHK